MIFRYISNLLNPLKSDCFINVTKKTMVVIDEVNTDNWGIGFDQVTELRK